MENPDQARFLEPTVETPGDREQLLRSFRLVLRLRFIIFPVVVALIFLASLAGLARQNLLDTRTLILHAVNAAVVLGLNLVALLLVTRLRNIAPLVLFQLAIDALNFTFTIYKTGSAASPLAFLYYGVIVAASILVGTRATFAMAGICGALYTAVVLMEALGVLPHQAYFIPLEDQAPSLDWLALVLLFTLFSLFLMAFLASSLARELRRRQRGLRTANAELERRLRTMLLLHRTTEAMNRARSLRGMADSILGELLSFLDLDRALLYLASGRQLRLLTVRYRPSARAATVRSLRVTIPLRADAGLTARVALRREALNLRKPEESPLLNVGLAKRIGMNPCALVPLVVRNRLVGVLGVDRSATCGEIDDDEFRLLQVFANNAAIAIAGLRKA